MVDNLLDSKLMCNIRQMNLDALWSREPSTVNANSCGLRMGLELLNGYDGDINVYPLLGPFPMRDTLGYGIALQMLEYSRRMGHCADYLQFEMIRKMWSCFSNAYHASAIGGGKVVSFGGEDKWYMALMQCPMQS